MQAARCGAFPADHVVTYARSECRSRLAWDSRTARGGNDHEPATTSAGDSGATIVLLSSGTTVLAATISSPVGPGGTIHGCYTTAATNGSHALVLQNTGTSCRADDMAIKWYKQGSPGPAGPSAARLCGWE